MVIIDVFDFLLVCWPVCLHAHLFLCQVALFFGQFVLVLLTVCPGSIDPPEKIF